MTTFSPPGSLETERLLLRPFGSDDLDSLMASYGREDVVRYLYEPAYSEADAREALLTKMANRGFEAEGDKLSLVLALRSDGSMVGDCVLGWMSEQHSQGEIGFVVHPDHHGHGYATEASSELLRIAFDEMGLHRVVGRAEARNVASARVMEKLGMRREAHLIENEYVKAEWQSELVYAILDREWRAGGA